MPLIVVADFFLGGHHREWLTNFAETLLRLGFRVACLSPDPELMRAEILRRISVENDALNCVLLVEPSPPKQGPKRLRRSWRALALWLRLRRTLRAPHLRADFVFLAWGDDFFGLGLGPWLPAFAVRAPWAALNFHPRYDRLSRRAKPPMLREDFMLTARECAAIALVDEGVAEKFARTFPGKPVVVFPDCCTPEEVPREPVAWIEEMRARARGRAIVGCFGALHPRKGILTLLEIAARAEPGEFLFLFAGQLDLSWFPPADLARWKEAVAQPRENCVFHLERLPGGEFEAAIAASDIVFAAYESFPHSSNILAQAAHARKPVVVSAGFCMAERVKKFALGCAVPERDAGAGLRALRELRATPAAPRGFAEYLEAQAPAKIGDCFRRIFAAAGVKIPVRAATVFSP